MPPASAPVPGDDYRIIRPLGPDGRGVFLAHDRALDRAVVLHMLPSDPVVRASMIASARALSRVTHPSLCRVHRIRESGEAACIVQSFERGSRLDSLVKPLPDETVRSIGLSLGGALLALHATGVAHGEINAGNVILSPSRTPCLLGLCAARVNADVEAKAEDVISVVELLVSLADTALRDSLSRWIAERSVGASLSAEALCRELDGPGSPARPSLRLSEPNEENPYRGLRPFEATQSQLFFGRHREVSEVLARLATAPWVVVVGASGAGKSSLVRAGIAPAIGDLGERDHWDVATMVPGPRPLSSLAAALAAVFARPANSLDARFRTDPGAAGRLARDRTDRGVLLVIDQLEEAMTLAEPVERDSFFAAIARFGLLAPGVRVVFTLRSDFLEQLGNAGTLARDLLRAAFVLPSMGVDALREAIVGPARARGFDFETTDMVDSLVTEARTETGGDALPLLSFALAELWTERDRERRVLPAAALKRLGGAAAALARHGDAVLSTLSTAERRAARAVLLALVTAEGTRARRTREELVFGLGADAERALEVLIRGRLVVAGEAYELAHEALVRAWFRLRGWLDEISDGRAAARRLASAAAEWDRLGRDAALLWGARQVNDLYERGGLVEADETGRAFVEASRTALRMARVRRLAIRLGLPLLLLAAAGCILGVIRWRERQATRAFLADKLADADRAIGDVERLDEEVGTARREAFARFDANDTEGGEQRWKEALDLAAREASAFAAASAPLGLALARDRTNPSARARAADLTYRWVLAALRDHDEELYRDLAARLAQLDDDGSLRARLAAPAHLRVTTDPPGASVMLHAVHLEAGGRRVVDEGRVITLGESLELPAGSYILEASGPGRYPTRFPVLLGRAEEVHVEVPLPASTDVPNGLVFVPAGVSLLGTAEELRAVFAAEPIHPVHVDAFLIGAREVTYAEYLDYLAPLSAPERTARRPHATGLDLAFGADGVPRLTMGTSTASYGEPLCRPARSGRRCQDWLRMPVAGLAWEDAQAYAAWLARGRVPGARLCTDREWERAARGADGRKYSHGDKLHAEDANFVETYPPGQGGVDEGGSFAIDRSPFDVFDLTGNVAEWNDGQQTGRAARGGAWYFMSMYARADCRNDYDDARYAGVGVRICAPLAKPSPTGH